MRCVEELERFNTRPNWSATRRRVWHLTTTRATADFAPIRCSKNEGIVFPGYPEERAPTCPDCMAIAADRFGEEES